MTAYEAIKQKCEEQGISIRQLEIKSGIGNGVIRRWQNTSPNMDTLKRVADGLQVNIKELL